MEDIRLKELPFDINGNTYMLRCNLNVLADLQEEFGGIPNILDEEKSMRNISAYIAAMANDYADEMGWPERYTARQIGRVLPAKPDMELMQDLIKIVINALYLKPDEETQEAGDGEKN